MVTPKTPISKSKTTSTMADDNDNNNTNNNNNNTDTNAITVFPVGSKVEVSSDEPGFHGAWYVATLLDINVVNPKNKNKKGSLVRYDTLVEDDKLNEMLTEVVDTKYVRPLPPPEYGGGGVVGFEVGDVIDAYYRDGWWIGVVVKKDDDDDDDDNMGKFVVCFESPYEEVEFLKNQLRVHVDWVDSCWKIFPKKMNKMIKTPKKLKLADKNDGQSGFTTPSEGPGELHNINSHSTRKLTRSQKRAGTSNSELVGALDGSVTNGRNRTADLNSRGERSRSSTCMANLGSKGRKKRTVPMMERSGSHAITQYSPLKEHELITTVTSEADDGTGQQKTNSGRPPKLPVNRNDSQEDNRKTRKRYALRDMTTDVDELPLSAWYQGLHPHSALKSSLCSSPCDRRDESSGPMNQTSVNNGGTGDYQQQWPFIKQSPVWATFKSLESYQKTPQKPHFTPLKERKEYFREGLAIAYVVTFEDMVRRVSSLRLTDPSDVINSCLEILVELESHGFDVRPVRDRLNALLTWKVKVGQLDDKLEKFKKDIEKCNLDKSAVEEETSQLEVKIRELQEKVVQNEKTISLKNEEINKFQVSAYHVSNQIMDWKFAFEKLAASPW